MIFNEKYNKIFNLMLDTDPKLFDEIDDYIAMIPNHILAKLQKGEDFKIQDKKEGVYSSYKNYDDEIEAVLKYVLNGNVKIIIEIKKLEEKDLLNMNILKEGEKSLITNEIGVVNILSPYLGLEYVFNIERNKEGYFIYSVKSMDNDGNGIYKEEYKTKKINISINNLIKEKNNNREKE